jgi:aminopeptidase YwaD
MNRIQFILSVFFILGFDGTLWSQADITAGELKNHVVFLASDSLKGRKPGTIESNMAAQYIADEFRQYGLKLPGGNGFQYFEVIAGVEAGRNTFKAGKEKFIFEKDFTVLSYSENARVNAGVVFAGYGFAIANEKMKWGDFENLDVKGKWVLILRGDPDNGKPMGRFAEYNADRSKVITARDRGAAGVIFVTPSGMEKEDALLPLSMGRGEVKSGLPVIQIKRVVADRILAKSGKKIEDLEKLLNESLKNQSFDLKVKADITTEVNFIKLKTQNVLGYLEGSHPELKNQYMVIGAHFDHLGMGGKGSGSRRPDTIAVHNGADDNASGIATVLEIAEFLASKKEDLKRSVLFMAFGAEEVGLLGSQYYVNNPLFDLKKAVAMFNFDMVGRLNPSTREVSVGGTGTAKEWIEILDRLKEEGRLKLAYSPEGYGPSDHASFYGHNIPVLYFNTGIHGDYHTPEDDAHLLNYQGQQDVSKLAAGIALEVLQSSNPLTFAEAGPKKQETGRGELKVRLGIMPGFASTDNKGLKVEGVTKDGPAYKAGLLTGDIITSMNGEKITNIYDYMDRLKKIKPGDRISIDVERNGEKKVFIVDL